MFQPSRSSLSPSAKTAVIVATVTGGIIVLSLVAVLLWRRRKGRKSSKDSKSSHIAPLRPPSTTTFLSVKTRDAKLTALPTYRDRRTQITGFGNWQTGVPPQMNELYKHDARLQDVWKTANPPTPITSQFPIHQDNESTQSHQRLREASQMKNASREIQVSSQDMEPAESIYAPSIVDIEATLSLQTPTSEQAPQDRWSWTTSFTTAQSRQDERSLASTVASLPGVRTVREWMGFLPDAQQQLSQVGEGESGPSRSSSITFLKNKATKPNLAPVPTRELSMRQYRPEPLFSGRKDSSVVRSKEAAHGDGVLEAIDTIVPDDGVIS